MNYELISPLISIYKTLWYYLILSWSTHPFLSFISFTFLWLINVNGMSTRPRLFYAKICGNYIHCTSIFRFFVLLFLRGFSFLYTIRSNTNNFKTDLFDPRMWPPNRCYHLGSKWTMKYWQWKITLHFFCVLHLISQHILRSTDIFNFLSTL